MKKVFYSLSLAAFSLTFYSCQSTDTTAGEPTKVYTQDPVSPAQRTAELQTGIGSIQSSTGGNID